MKKRRVIILGGNTDQLKFIDEIKKQGFYTILCDKNNDCIAKEKADEFYNIGYDDKKKLIFFANKIQLTERDFLFTAASQFAYVGISLLSELVNLGLPNAEIIENCLDKNKFYKLFESNGIKIPKTEYLENKNQLLKLFDSINNKDFYFLKSDFSKNPNYIYRINKVNFSNTKINWIKDRYFRKYYIFQKEFKGKNLRINIFNGRYNIFNFENSELAILNKYQLELFNKKIFPKLSFFVEKFNLNKYLTKFDLIIDKNNWCALDIGLDTPSRMMNFYKKQNINFEKYYVDYYLRGICKFPL
tara:strand:- start:47 stop:949 length:903 start_codon:yes stop_codon:yes gene_type:complete